MAISKKTMAYCNDTQVQELQKCAAHQINYTAQKIMIVDSGGEYIYSHTYEELVKNGYTVHVLNLNNPEYSDQYGILMDIFSLLEKEVDSESIAEVLADLLIDNGRYFFRHELGNSVFRLYDSLHKEIMEHYENGDADIHTMFDSVAEEVPYFKPIWSDIKDRYGDLLSGYDFTLDGLEDEDTVYFIIPPERYEVTSRKVNAFIIPFMLIMFCVFADKKYSTQIMFYDVEQIGTISPEILTVIEKCFDTGDIDIIAGFNVDRYRDIVLTKTAREMISYFKRY